MSLRMGGVAQFLSLCALLLVLPSLMRPGLAFAQQITVTIDPTQSPPRTSVTGTGSLVNFGYGQPGHRIQVVWDDTSQTVLANTTLLSDRTFSVSFTIPANATVGAHTIHFIDIDLGTGFVLGSPTFTVVMGHNQPVVKASQDLPGLDTGIDVTAGDTLIITAAGQAAFGTGSPGSCSTTEQTLPDGQRITTDGTLGSPGE